MTEICSASRPCMSLTKGLQTGVQRMVTSRTSLDSKQATWARGRYFTYHALSDAADNNNNNIMQCHLN